MNNRCPYCGTKLSETNYGRKHCPNHGIIENEENNTESERNYIG